MYTLEEFHTLLLETAKEEGHKLTDSSWTVFVIRACSIKTIMGETYFYKSENTFNKYDDLIILLRGDEMKCYKGTCDPGKKYTDDPMNADGCFHLLNGLWWFKKGFHFEIEAFVQAKPVKGWRDKNKNNLDDDKIIVEGFFGIHWHPGSGNENHIDGWSAGCINTLGNKNSISWKECKGTLYKSAQSDYKSLIPVIVSDFPEAA